MTHRTPFYFGTESEFAVLGEKAAREQFVHELPFLCQNQFSSLPSQHNNRDLFLPWGRLYIDVGFHPEWATAESSDPWMVVHLQKVGEMILSKIVKDFSGDVIISRHNVDFISDVSWGAHESYLTQNCSFQRLAKVLIPHLVTRLLYTGGGGLKIDFENKTCQFLISPRAEYLRSIVHSGSQSNRPLFHLKNEPLCKRYKRLHLICGENLYSETAGFLKVATTALLIILADHQKVMPIFETFRDSPLHCIRDISTDIHLKKKFQTKTGEIIRPLDIQWHYLEYVYANIDQPFMPPWGRFTCELWQQTLQKLENGWQGVSDRLDWAAKLNLLEKKLNVWNRSFFDSSSPVELTKEQLYELFQLDLCCSVLGDICVFTNMESKGWFKHQVTGVPGISNTADFQNPVLGRAAIRAETIDKLYKQNKKQYHADWTTITDRDGKEMLDLQEVDSMEEKWVDPNFDETSLLVKALKMT